MGIRSERRKHKRYYFKALLQMIGSAEFSSVTLEAINISAGGLFFRSNEMLEQDQEIVLIVTLPDHPEPVKTRCRVIHSLETIPGKQYFIGVQFIDLEKISFEDFDAKLKDLFN